MASGSIVRKNKQQQTIKKKQGAQCASLFIIEFYFSLSNDNRDLEMHKKKKSLSGVCSCYFVCLVFVVEGEIEKHIILRMTHEFNDRN